MASIGGSVFLADVDSDYINPSTACINPLFSSENEGANRKQAKSVGQSGAALVSIDSGIFSGISEGTNEKDETVARVTLADCLACSGCVTSAETVLVTSHSLEKLKTVLSQQQSKTLVLSISPHARASLARHFNLDLTATHKRLDAYFRRAGFDYVFDTSSAADIAREEVAAEFFARWRNNKSHTQHDKGGHWKRPRETISKSAQKGVFADSGKDFAYEKQMGFENQHLPLLTSSCPGWVCYAEKNCAEALPYMSTSKSPQHILGRLLKGSNISKTLTSIKDGAPVYHVTLMPCYDKKLEASRKDFANDSGVPDVDLVITPIEVLDMFSEQGLMNFQALPEGSFPKGDDGSILQRLLVGVERVCGEDHIVTSPYDTTESGSSGGYLDYTLRATAHKLCLKRDYSNTLNFRVGRNKDFKVTELVDDEGKVILRFAIAFGFRNIQSIVRQIKIGKCKYDFVEVQACPSGCLNGGAQVRGENRLSSKRILDDVKKIYCGRLGKAFSTFPSSRLGHIYNDILQDEPYSFKALDWFHTQYHAVPQMSAGSTW